MTATTWVRPVRERFHSITLTFNVQDVNKLIDFLKQAFEAKQTYHGIRLGGSVIHAEVKIGDSFVMMGEPTG